MTTTTTVDAVAPEPKRDPSRPPAPLGVQADAIPQELRVRPSWVVWRWEWNAGKGAWDKPPCSAETGRHVDAHDTANWRPFHTALAFQRKRLAEDGGAGFVLSPLDPYAVWDLDRAVDPATGRLRQWAEPLVLALNSYTELSPSGTGVKVWVRATKPAWARCKARVADGEVEFYAEGRYLTVTGRRWDGTPARIREAQQAVDELSARLWPPVMGPQPVPHPRDRGAPPALDDEKLLAVMFGARNGAEVRSLWEGSLAGHGGDHSRADQALCNHLAFYTGNDAARMDRLFRQSGLLRPKWDEVHNAEGETYAAMTIHKAIEATTDVYQPAASGPRLLPDGKTVDGRPSAPAQPTAGATPPGDQPDGYALSTVCLAGVVPRPLRWLAPGRVPRGKLVMYVGDGGHGKSTLTLDHVACLTTGRAWFGLDYDPPPAARALLISCEDDIADTVVPRLAAAGADLNLVHHVDGIRGKDGKLLPFSLAHYDLLEKELKSREYGLVVIDPAGAYIGRAGVDDHKDSELRALLGPLAELAASTDATVLLVKHLNKSATARAVHRVGGSVGYVNAVRAAFLVVPDEGEDGRRLLLPIKFNIAPKPQGLAFRPEALSAEKAHEVVARWEASLGPEERERLGGQLFRIGWQGEVDVEADDALARASAGPGGAGKDSKLGAAVAWLEELFLGHEAVPANTVFAWGKEAGHSQRTLERAKKEINSGEEVLLARNRGRFQGVWWWGTGDPESWDLSGPEAARPPHRQDANEADDAGGHSPGGETTHSPPAGAAGDGVGGLGGLAGSGGRLARKAAEALAQACDWLRDQLTVPRRVKFLRDGAKKAKVAVTALYRAKERLGVVEEELDGKQWWRLPEHPIPGTVSWTVPGGGEGEGELER